MTVRLYTRVSSASQVDAFSLSSQRNRGEAWARLHELGPVQLYEERGISGQRNDRPELTSLLRDIQPGDVVLIYSLSRLGRGGITQLLTLVKEIGERGARLVSMTESIDTESITGRMMLGFSAVLTHAEVETTRERTTEGRVQAAEEGVFPHNADSLPMGYTRDAAGRIVASALADDLRLIFNLASGGTPFKAIARELTRRGVPTKTGLEPAQWTSSAVGRIVRRTTYATGIFPYRKSAHPGAPETWINIPAPPLVSESVWDAAQRPRSQNHRKRDPGRYPLTGRLNCSCGAPLVGSSNKPRHAGSAGYRYYTCRQDIRGTPLCPATGKGNPSYDADEVESRARSALAELLCTPQALALLAARNQPPPDPHAGERANIQERLNRLVDLHLEQDIDRDEYKRRRAELTARLDALVMPAVELSAAQPDLRQYAEAVRTLPPDGYLALLKLLQVRWDVTREEVHVTHISVPV